MPRDGEEGAHAVGPLLPVDVAVVVGVDVEGHERLAGLVGPPPEVLVEHLLPGGGVDGGRPGQDAVEVEQAGADAVRKTEHGCLLPVHAPGAHRPRTRRYPARLPSVPWSSERAVAVLATLALVATVRPDARPAKADPGRRRRFRIGLIGDTGYDAQGEANFLRVRESANACGAGLRRARRRHLAGRHAPAATIACGG